MKNLLASTRRSVVLGTAAWFAVAVVLCSGCQASSPTARRTPAEATAAAEGVGATGVREPPTPGAVTPKAVTPKAVSAHAADPHAADPNAADEVPRVHVRAEGQLGPGGGVLFIDLAPPAGAKLTLDAPLSVRGGGGIGLGFPRPLSGPLGEHRLPLRMPIDVLDGATGPAELQISYYWCTDGNEAACRREQARLRVELDLTGGSAGGEAHLSYRARGDKS